MGIIRHRQQKPGDSAHAGIDRPGFRAPNPPPRPASTTPAGPPRSTPPGFRAPTPPPRPGSTSPAGAGGVRALLYPTERLTIGGTAGSNLQPNPVPNTRAARKANSPRKKAKALKAINKTPLTPTDLPWEGSEAGFKESEPAQAYSDARRAHERLNSPLIDSTMYQKQEAKTLHGNPIPSMKDRDTDRVGAYINTGESPYGSKGRKWVGKHGVEAKKKKNS